MTREGPADDVPVLLVEHTARAVVVRAQDRHRVADLVQDQGAVDEVRARLRGSHVDVGPRALLALLVARQLLAGEGPGSQDAVALAPCPVADEGVAGRLRVEVPLAQHLEGHRVCRRLHALARDAHRPHLDHEPDRPEDNDDDEREEHHHGASRRRSLPSPPPRDHGSHLSWGVGRLVSCLGDGDDLAVAAADELHVAAVLVDPAQDLHGVRRRY